MEKVHSIDYGNCTSPDPDIPDLGFLAVEAVKLLSPYVRNFVLETPNSIMVPQPFEIQVPPLQTFTFIALTGKVIARTVFGTCAAPEQAAASSAAPAQAKAAAAKAKGGPGSKAGVQPPSVTPKAKRAKVAVEEEDDDLDSEEEVTDNADQEDGDEDGGNAQDDDVAELAALEEELSKKNGKRAAKATPKSNKKAKSA